MTQTLIVRGRYIDHQFIPEGPLPDAEGTAQLIIIPTSSQSTVSIFDLVVPESDRRTAQDIAAQVREEHDAWDDR